MGAQRRRRPFHLFEGGGIGPLALVREQPCAVGGLVDRVPEQARDGARQRSRQMRKMSERKSAARWRSPRTVPALVRP